MMTDGMDLTEVVRMCCCHGHIDGLTLAEMADLGAPCPTTAAVERIVTDRERAAAVGALRDAAELLMPLSGIGMGSGPTRSEVSEWLRARADRQAGDRDGVVLDSWEWLGTDR